MAFQSSVMFWLVIKCDYFKSCPIDICFTEQGAQQLKQALSLPKDQKSLKWGSNRRKHQCCELTPSAWLVPNQKLSCYKSTHIPRVTKTQHHNSTGRAKYRWKQCVMTDIKDRHTSSRWWDQNKNITATAVQYKHQSMLAHNHSSPKTTAFLQLSGTETLGSCFQLLFPRHPGGPWITLGKDPRKTRLFAQTSPLSTKGRLGSG